MWWRCRSLAQPKYKVNIVLCTDLPQLQLQLFWWREDKFTSSYPNNVFANHILWIWDSNSKFTSSHIFIFSLSHSLLSLQSHEQIYWKTMLTHYSNSLLFLYYFILETKHCPDQCLHKGVYEHCDEFTRVWSWHDVIRDG